VTDLPNALQHISSRMTAVNSITLRKQIFPHRFPTTTC